MFAPSLPNSSLPSTCPHPTKLAYSYPHSSIYPNHSFPQQYACPDLIFSSPKFALTQSYKFDPLCSHRRVDKDKRRDVCPYWSPPNFPSFPHPSLLAPLFTEDCLSLPPTKVRPQQSYLLFALALNFFPLFLTKLSSYLPSPKIALARNFPPSSHKILHTYARY